MADDSFHEIQLSGKQLVFLFMAITVVSVVIFLCGVLVGRGCAQPAEHRTGCTVRYRDTDSGQFGSGARGDDAGAGATTRGRDTSRGGAT